MIYPDSYQKKIGFADLCTLIKGRCLSSLGTEWVDEHVAFSTSADEVRENLQVADEFAHLLMDEEEIGEGFYDIRTALMRIRPERTHMDEAELFDLARTLSTVETLLRAMRSGCDDEDGVGDSALRYPALARMSEEVEALPLITDQIAKVLNKYGKVKDTASPALLSIRHQLEVTSRGISHALRGIINEARTEGYIDRDVTPTLRDGRLVIPVAPALKRKIRGIIHDESASGKTVFIEPAPVVEANNKIRELRAAEQREILRILSFLSAEIRPHIPEILRSQLFLARVDYLRALTATLDELEAVVPEVVQSPRIAWTAARHPLLQRNLAAQGREIVPLDINIKGDNRMVLISGPNAGGKSICLKTVGLLQYMLQCGMPIPVAEGSKAGIFDSIFIDIGDEQSIEDDLSTYSSHLYNMNVMMRHATANSLVLIDEMGGGTEPQIGGAMAEAILARLLDNQAWGIVTTHYQNLKQFAATHPAIVNAAMLYDRAKMQPLYMLRIGNQGSSFALEIAQSIGLPQEVIAHAQRIVGKDYVMSDKYLQDIQRDKSLWERKRKGVEEREKNLQTAIDRYENELVSLSAQKREVLSKAKEDAQQLLQETNAKIENTIRQIKEAGAERQRTREVRQQLDDFRQDLQSDASRAEEEDAISRKIAKIQRREQRKRDKRNNVQTADGAAQPAVKSNAVEALSNSHTYAVGDYVRMKGSEPIGQIQQIRESEAKVLFGVISTTIALDRLCHAEKPKPDVTKQTSTFITRETRDAMRETKLNFRPEIDIRGMRAEEALTAIAYFIDDAIQCEQSRVRILHGTGTGVLRQIVRAYLETVPLVGRYHDEHVQFGGAGITVVEFS